MKTKTFLLLSILLAGAVDARADGAVTARTDTFRLDLRPSPRVVQAGATETLAYSTRWDGGDAAAIALDGTPFGSYAGEGTVAWTPSASGLHSFTHGATSGGAAVGETLSASFLVEGIDVSDLTILATGDLKEGAGIALGGAPDGWTLHYTTDGSAPTAASPEYTGPFALAQSATVKVVAVSPGGFVSDVASQRFDLAPPLSVTGSRVRQRYPWNGLVDVDFTLEGDPVCTYRVALVARDVDGGTNLAVRTVWEDRGAVTNDAVDLRPGVHRLVWNAAADLPEGFAADRVAIGVRADTVQDTSLYMVVDLSGGPDAERYPVSYLPDVPEGGWTDEYKTDKLVLRRVEPGTFLMGSPEWELTRNDHATPHDVTLTHSFYAGVFETTQRQWELVKGDRPSYFVNDSCYMPRPVETIHWPEIRGNNVGNSWPDNAEVDEGTFMAIVRSKTGNNCFDLPTEAQWEYACRAGTTTSFNNGTNVRDAEIEPNADAVGRHLQNGGDEGQRVIETASGTSAVDISIGTAKVGSYIPNAWGLYDMHGNVAELCLDWFQIFTSDSVIDPKGPRDGEQFVSSVGVQRTERGNSIHHKGPLIHSGRRGGYPVGVSGNYKGDDGFRLFLHNAPAVVEAPIVAPAGLTATSNRVSDITLAWQPVAGAYAYQIRRSKTGAFEDGTWLNTVTNTTYADWTAESRTNYTYWVRAQFESGRIGQWSEAAQGRRSE